MNNDGVTKKDIQILKNDIDNVRKELLDKLVSKEEHRKDIAKLATKEELKQEVAKLATKKELKWEIYQVRQELAEFKNETNSKLDHLIRSVDGIVGMLRDGQVEKAAMEATFQRHEKRIDDHETRIQLLEKQQAV